MDFENLGKDDSNSGDSAKEPKLSEQDKAKIQQAIDLLKPIADREGCDIADLIDDAQNGDDGADDAGGDGEDDGKVGLIVARLKAKNQEE